MKMHCYIAMYIFFSFLPLYSLVFIPFIFLYILYISLHLSIACYLLLLMMPIFNSYCCNITNFPIVGQIKDDLILSYIKINGCKRVCKH